MDYSLEIEPAAERDLRKLSRHAEHQAIVSAIRNLTRDPRPHGTVKLRERDGFRIRVGQFRIIYEIRDAARVVSVTRVRHRRDVYD